MSSGCFILKCNQICYPLPVWCVSRCNIIKLSALFCKEKRNKNPERRCNVQVMVVTAIVVASPLSWGGGYSGQRGVRFQTKLCSGTKTITEVHVSGAALVLQSHPKQQRILKSCRTIGSEGLAVCRNTPKQRAALPCALLALHPRSAGLSSSSLHPCWTGTLFLPPRTARSQCCE